MYSCRSVLIPKRNEKKTVRVSVSRFKPGFVLRMILSSNFGDVESSFLVCCDGDDFDSIVSEISAIDGASKGLV